MKSISYYKFFIDSLLLSLAERSYLNTDMCKFESLQKDERRGQSADSSSLKPIENVELSRDDRIVDFHHPILSCF